MTAERLLQNFDRLIDTPDAVPRLRRFILDLAVQGKLVEQNTEDEPAAELLKRIETQKVRFVKTGDNKNNKLLPLIDEETVPFGIPEFWKWVPIRKITSDRGQKIPDKKFSYIDVSAIDKEHGEICEPQILTPDIAPSRARKIVQRGDVIYACVRPYLLNIAVIKKEFTPEPIVSTAFAVLNGFGLIVPQYLWIVLRSSYFVICVEDKMRGQAYPAINDSDFANLPFPLPPLAEQHRIVAKVDELMALCDELEAEQTKRERRRVRLVAATLHGMNNGETDLEAKEKFPFEESARFYFNHLPHLTTRPEHIQQLRQTILNLAVRGKLVPQDPNEGTGRELLEQLKLAHPKNRMFGRHKKVLQSLDPLNCPGIFEIPTSWGWSFLDFVCEQIGDIDHKMPKTAANGVPFISAKDLKDDGTINFRNAKMISEEDYERLSRKIKLQRDDIIYSRIGARLGKARCVDVDTRFLISYSCCLIRPMHKFIDKGYLQRFLDSRLALKQAHKSTQSIGVPDLGLGEIKEFKIPLPPIAEQRRIVAKMDELMALCGELENYIAENDSKRQRLLEATLQKVLAG